MVVAGRLCVGMVGLGRLRCGGDVGCGGWSVWGVWRAVVLARAGTTALSWMSSRFLLELMAGRLHDDFGLFEAVPEQFRLLESGRNRGGYVMANIVNFYDIFRYFSSEDWVSGCDLKSDT